MSLFISNVPNTGGGSGTVTNVATSTGLTGGPITNTGTIALNSKLAPADTLTGNSLKVLRVNAGETAVEYATVSGTGDMVLANAQTNTGAKTFLDATMLLRNVANTFSSWFTNTATVARTWTLPDKNGTVAMTSDITGTNSGTNTGDQTITLTGHVTGSGTGSFATSTASKMILQGTTDATTSAAQFLGALATGIIKNTTTTGVLSIATGADLPAMTATVGGAVPTPPNNTTTFLRGDGTFATPTGGGTVTASGGSLTANSIVLGAGTTDTKVSTGITTDGASQVNLGVNATTIGKLKMFGNTSGDVTIQPTAAAGTATVQTLPATTGTLVNRVTTANGVSASNTDGALSFSLGALTTGTINGQTISSAANFTGGITSLQSINTNNAITATGNAATVPVTSKINTVTNNSAATLTITLTTASAVDGQMVMVRIKDFSAVAQTITWVNTEDSTVTAPTTSNGSTTLPLTAGFQFNSSTTKWRCIAKA